MRTEFSRFVEADLEAIGDYIAQDNPRRAVSFIREIRAKINAISAAPLHYRLRPELGEDARLGVVGRYVILFSIAADVVRIERVAYGGRELNALLEQDDARDEGEPNALA